MTTDQQSSADDFTDAFTRLKEQSMCSDTRTEVSVSDLRIIFADIKHLSELKVEEAMRRRSNKDLGACRQLLERYHLDKQPNNDASTSEWMLSLLLSMHPSEVEDPHKKIVTEAIETLKAAGRTQQAELVAELWMLHQRRDPVYKFAVGDEVMSRKGNHEIGSVAAKEFRDGEFFYKLDINGICRGYKQDFVETNFVKAHPWKYKAGDVLLAPSGHERLVHARVITEEGLLKYEVSGNSKVTSMRDCAYVEDNYRVKPIPVQAWKFSPGDVLIEDIDDSMADEIRIIRCEIINELHKYRVEDMVDGDADDISDPYYLPANTVDASYKLKSQAKKGKAPSTKRFVSLRELADDVASRRSWKFSIGDQVVHRHRTSNKSTQTIARCLFDPMTEEFLYLLKGEYFGSGAVVALRAAEVERVYVKAIRPKPPKRRMDDDHELDV